MFLTEDPSGSRRKIVHDHGGAEIAGPIPFRLRTIPGADKDTTAHAGVPATFQINHFIAHHVALSEIYAEFVARVEKKLRGRFASAARGIGGLWGNIDFVEFYAFTAEFLTNMFIYFFHISKGEIP